MQDGRAGGKWATVFRTTALAATLSGITALGLLLLRQSGSTRAYFWQNAIAFDQRVQLVAGVFLAAGLAGLVVLGLAAALSRRVPELPGLLSRGVATLSPVAPLATVPILLRWQLWNDHELPFLSLVLAASFGLKWAVAAAIEARPVELLGISSIGKSVIWTKFRARVGTMPGWGWLLIILAVVLAYAIWFSYYTVVWHRSARSGWDLSIEDNILWNILHGGHFFKAGPALGPTGSHFARHSALIAYLLVPFYALHQSAEMVLILQTVLMGAAAIPLYLLGRQRVGAPLAALIAVLYLMHPALQESNLFEMHYVKLGNLPFWTTLWLLDTRRYRGALVAAALTLAVREDVATWIVLLGALGIAVGLHLRVSLTLFIGGLLYVAIVKFVIMPSLVNGQDVLMFMYKDLLPAGKNSFGWAMVTALTNPAFLLDTLLTQEKLVYLLQVLTPILFIPLRRPIGWFALIPGFVFNFLATHYSPLVDIHFQYSPHLLAMFYPALVVVLGEDLDHSASARRIPTSARLKRRQSRRIVRRSDVVGDIAAMTVATLLCSSQFGAVIQQNTSRGGPITYKFGWDEEGRKRYQALQELQKLLPSEASVAASAFTITQVSARPDAFSLSISIYDADYIIATTNKHELISDERTRLLHVLETGEYGVVAVKEPFFLLRRGHSTSGNEQIRDAIR